MYVHISNWESFSKFLSVVTRFFLVKNMRMLSSDVLLRGDNLLITIINCCKLFQCHQPKCDLIWTSVAVKTLCPPSELKLTFNQITSNRPVIQLTNQSDSAALVHDIWTQDTVKEFQDCVFMVDSNLYTPNERIGRGVFLSVRKMNFRQNSRGECIDYVRFHFNNGKTEKMCGTFEAESPLGQTAFFNDANGVVKVHVFVNKTIPFRELQHSVDVELIFTAFESKYQLEIQRMTPILITLH